MSNFICATFPHYVQFKVYNVQISLSYGVAYKNNIKMLIVYHLHKYLSENVQKITQKKRGYFTHNFTTVLGYSKLNPQVFDVRRIWLNFCLFVQIQIQIFIKT